MKNNIFFIISEYKQSKNWSKERFVVNAQPKEYKRRTGVPQKLDKIHGEKMHAYRKASYAGIQTKYEPF